MCAQKGLRTLYQTDGSVLVKNCSLPANAAHQFTVK